MWARDSRFSTPPSEQLLEIELASALGREHANITDLATTPDGQRLFAVWSGSYMLVRTLPNTNTSVGNIEATRSHGNSGVARIAPSPKGDLLALVHFDGHVSVHDALTLERRWTRVDTHATALGWSQNGTRLVVAGTQGGSVLDATTGELELERRDLGLHVERNENQMPVSDSLQDDQLPNR
jgi:hypothetical protein